MSIQFVVYAICAGGSVTFPHHINIKPGNPVWNKVACNHKYVLKL